MPPVRFPDPFHPSLDTFILKHGLNGVVCVPQLFIGKQFMYLVSTRATDRNSFFAFNLARNEMMLLGKNLVRDRPSAKGTSQDNEHGKNLFPPNG